MKYQLLSKDEYGQKSIINTFDSISDAVKEAMDYVSKVNVENSLTEEDRNKSWEAFFPLIDIGDEGIAVYAERAAKPAWSHGIYVLKNDDISPRRLLDFPSAKIKMYLGNICPNPRKGTEDWFAKDYKGKLIEDIDHMELNDKTVLFIKCL